MSKLTEYERELERAEYKRQQSETRKATVRAMSSIDGLAQIRREQHQLAADLAQVKSDVAYLKYAQRERQRLELDVLRKLNQYLDQWL